MTRLALSGASGRMGLAILRELPRFPDLKLVAALVSPASGALGKDSGALAGLGNNGVAVGADLEQALKDASLVIDFSSPEHSERLLEACVRRAVPALFGTTGLSAGFDAKLAEAARSIPVLRAANTSVGLAVLLDLARRAAAALPAEFDLEIVESHHRLKRDAPSGTALALAAAAGEGRGQSAADSRRGAGGSRAGERMPGQIGFAVLRGGDEVGEHELRFLGEGEQVVLGHRATDRGIFARGALGAGAWLAGQGPGSYQMRDFLQLN